MRWVPLIPAALVLLACVVRAPAARGDFREAFGLQPYGDYPEPDVVVAAFGLESLAEGGAAGPAGVGPGAASAASGYVAVFAGCGFVFGVVQVRVCSARQFRHVPVAAPLDHVALHVVQAPGVGRVVAYGCFWVLTRCAFALCPQLTPGANLVTALRASALPTADGSRLTRRVWQTRRIQIRSPSRARTTPSLSLRAERT
jgi:hypothetical protein